MVIWYLTYVRINDIPGGGGPVVEVLQFTYQSITVMTVIIDEVGSDQSHFEFVNGFES